MKYGWVIQALIDGTINAIGYIFLELLVTSVLFENMYATIPLLFVSVTPAALLSVVYLMFLRSKNSIKDLIWFSSISAIAFIFGIIIYFVISISFPVEIPFQRELCNADGFIIIFVALLFLGASIAFRSTALVYLIIKTKHTTKKNSVE